jgi:hypothetical protein
MVRKLYKGVKKLYEINDIIFEKYLQGKIDDDHYLELLEKANIYDEEFDSFKVKKTSEMRPDEIKRNKELAIEFKMASDEKRRKMAEKYYRYGRADGVLLPEEKKIARYAIAIMKKSDRREKIGIGLNAGIAAFNTVLAKKNLKSNNKFNKAIGAGNTVAAGCVTYATAKDIKRMHEKRKNIKEQTSKRNSN